MDIEQKQRRQKIRIIATEVVMVISVVVIVVLLMFMVMGYSLKTGGDEWGLEQSGLVQLASTPSGASIEIDGGGIFQRTETSRMMSEGQHSVKLYRDGYDSWSKQITVRPGVFLRLKYPRLFRNDRESEEVKTLTDVGQVSFADNRNSLLYWLKNNTKNWHWVSLKDDNLTEVELDTSAFLTGEVKNIMWVGNGEKILAETVENGGTRWSLIDLVAIERSVDLSAAFGMDFSMVKPLNDAADRMWAVENGNLRALNISNKEISGVLMNNVVEFANNREELVYVTRESDGKRTIGTYKNGAKTGVKVRQVESQDLAVRVAVEEYLGDTYLSYTIGRQLFVFKGNDFPAEGRDFAMEQVLEEDTQIMPEMLEVSNNGQLAIMAEGAKMVVMDTETEQVYRYTLESEQRFWVDDYLIGVVADGELMVRDFDGTNRRVLAKASGNYPAIITVSNKWLYYFTENEGQVVLKREQL